MGERRRLPLGIQTFREIREENYYYVDKTSYVERLLKEGKHYFLSRPRRFGKSLFLDTLKEFFEGNEELFRGLAIYQVRDCSVRHPVVRLSFGSGNFTAPGLLEDRVMEQLAAVERQTGVATDYRTAPGRLASLLEALHRQAGQRGSGTGGRVRQTDPGRAGERGGGPRQPRLPAGAVRGDQGRGRPCALHVSDRGEQVLEGQSAFRPQQAHRPHSGSSLRCRLA